MLLRAPVCASVSVLAEEGAVAPYRPEHPRTRHLASPWLYKDGLSGAARCEYDFGFGLLTASYEGGLVDGQLHGQGLYTAGSR